MNTLLQLLCLFVLICQGASFTSSAVVSLSNISDVTLNVTCSLPSSSALFAAWLGNNHLPLSSATIQANLGNSTINYTQSIIYGSQRANASTSFNFTIKAEHLRNSGENYTVLVYCLDQNSNPSNGVYGKWAQPDNHGYNFEINITYNWIFNATLYQKAQAQAILNCFPQLNPDNVVDLAGESAQKPALRSLAEENQNQITNMSTYILRDYATFNDTTSQVLSARLNNISSFSEQIETYLNNSGFSQNFSILSVTPIKLKNPSLNITIFGATANSIYLLLTSTVVGSYYLVGTFDMFYDPQYLSNANVKNFTDENGNGFPWAYNYSANITDSEFIKVILPNNTNYLAFYAVLEDNLTRPSLSNITSEIYLTTPEVPYLTAIKSRMNGSHVTLTLKCSLQSTYGFIGIRIGKHFLASDNITAQGIEACSQAGNVAYYPQKYEKLCFNQSNVGKKYTFTIPKDNLKNSGTHYTYIGYCSNSIGNYSQEANGSWFQPDNNGRFYQIDVKYQGMQSPKIINSFQMEAVISILSNASSYLWAGFCCKYNSYYILPDGNTTFPIYLDRNYSFVNDNSGYFLQEFFSSNQSEKVNQIQEYYNKYGGSNFTVLGVTLKTLNNTEADFSVVGYNSSSFTFQLQSNVDGYYSVCVMKNQSNTDYSNFIGTLNPSDVNLGIGFAPESRTIEIISSGIAENITISNLTGNTDYLFFAVVKNQLFDSDFTPIIMISGKTSASTSFQGKLSGFAFNLILVLLFIGFFN